MAIKTWIGTTANWNVASNWSPASVPTSTDDLVFNNSANCNVNVSYTFNSIDFNGYTGTFSNSANFPLTIVGSNDGTSTGISLRLSTGMTYNFTPIINFTSAVGGYIYSSGKTFNGGLTFNNATGVWSNQDALNSSAAITLTTGTFNANANITTSGTYTFTSGVLNLGSSTHNFNAFSSNNTNTRTLNFGTCSINLTGNSTIIWYSGFTNLTILGTKPTINCTYSGSIGTRQISPGIAPEADSLSFNITAGSDIIADGSGTQNYKTLNFTGFSGTYTSTAIKNIYGNITYSATQTITGTTALNFIATSTTQTITSNAVTITFPIVINSATTTVQNLGTLTTTAALTVTSGTFNINDNLTIGSASAFTFTAGTINANNGANITCGSFVGASGGGVRVLNMGWGTWTLTSTGGWAAGTTNYTLNAGQSRIVFTDISASAINFTSAQTFTYYTVEYARGGGGGSLIFINSIGTTITNFIDNTSTAAHSVLFSSGQWYFHKFNVRGSAGALITIGRNGATSPIISKVGRSIIPYCDYLNIVPTSFSATPANTWYAGANSTGSGGGWVMTIAPSSQSLLGAGGVG